MYDVTFCLADRSYVPSSGVSVPCSFWGVTVQGVWGSLSIGRGVTIRGGGNLCPGDMVTSGRYASYWDAFLLKFIPDSFTVVYLLVRSMLKHKFTVRSH